VPADKDVILITPRPGRLEDTVPLVPLRSRYLYHATLDKNLRSIQEKGLKPLEDTSQCNWGGYFAGKCLGKAYLTRDLGFALYYAGIIAREIAEQSIRHDEETIPPEIILLRVPARKVWDAKRDEHTGDDYFVQRTIPASDIEYLHGEGCWKKLSVQRANVIEGISDGEWREPAEDPDLYKEIDNRKRVMENMAKMCSRKRR
jgi:hypothetical protein